MKYLKIAALIIALSGVATITTACGDGYVCDRQNCDYVGGPI